MIRLADVTKRYGAWAAVDGLSLDIAEGELCVLMGASGSGKSTTLCMINRLVERDAGQILVHGTDVRDIAPEILRRRMGYAIQSIGLFPHWTVERNVATVPQLLGWPRARIRDRVTELLDLLGLDPARFRHRYPHHLSGGQQQRVGVARALAGDPEVLLMDEPFGALDPVTRAALQDELLRIHRVSGKTIVLVTHDVDEALRLGTRVVLLDRGRILQTGPPLEILDRPASRAVAEFVGRDDLGIRRLAATPVADRMRRGQPASGEPLPESASLRRALSALLEQGTDCLPVVGAEGQSLGSIHAADILRPPA